MSDKASILIVEDESIVALNMAQILTGLGYRVLGPASSGTRALRIIASDRPDLVLMDIKLKGNMDGIQVAEQIKSSERIPIVYVSTYSDDLTLERAKLTEPYGYITKSFEDRELHSTIEMALYKHKMEERLLEQDGVLSTTLNSILDGVITTDKDGTVRFLNSAAQGLLGVEVEKATGKRFSELARLIDGSGIALLEPFLEQSVARLSGSTHRCLLLANGASRAATPAEFTISPLVPSGIKVAGYVLVIRDVTHLLLAEAARAQLAAIVESSDDSIISATLDGSITSWNPGAEKMFGYTEAEAVGRNLALLTPTFWGDEMPAILEKLSRGEIIDHYETSRQKKNGELIDVSLKASAIKDPQGNAKQVSLIARDITAKKNLDKRILEIRLREQARIGRDLHDSLGQELAGILFKVKALEIHLAGMGIREERDQIVEIEQLIKEAVVKTRELAAGLIPATLQSLGLRDALKELVSKVAMLYEIKTLYECSEQVSVADQVVVTELYHIAEEALTNAARHAGATLIEVRLEEDSHELTMSIRDNGGGLRNRTAEGLGLRIMDYRATSINARLAISTPVEGGTAVICRLPLTAATAGEAI